jgi:aminopeptidase N
MTDELMRATYAHDDQWCHDSGLVALPSATDTMSSNQVYHGRALVLYALRQVIGDARFQRIERGWVDRRRDGSASTADFIALTSPVSHRDLSGFLRACLYGITTPPMRRHTDWKTDPVVELAPMARTLAA